MGATKEAGKYDFRVCQYRVCPLMQLFYGLLRTCGVMSAQRPKSNKFVISRELAI